MRKIILSIINAFMFSENNESKKMPIGGQAVIEGVLMRGHKRWGLAIRKPEGDIFHEVWENKPWTLKNPWKLPFIRGVVTLVDMMRIGIRALNRSAEIALGEQEKLTKKDFAIAVVVAIIAVVGLFLALPLWISDVCLKYFSLTMVQKNIAEGIARGLVFVGYVALIGLWSDIKQVFCYHGAEHKTINAFESGVVDFTPEKVAEYSRIHPRCGTSFLLVVIVVSIIVFSIAGHGSLLWRVASRVVLLPIVMGISYEIIKGSTKMGIFGKIIMYPMMLLQYLTTREPNLKQLEVSIESLKIALGEDSEASQ